MSTNNETPAKIGIGVLVTLILVVVAIGLVGHGENRVAYNCDKLGVFFANNKVYLCEPKKEDSE